LSAGPVLAFFAALASAAPSSIAFLAASDRNDLFCPVVGDVELGEAVDADALAVPFAVVLVVGFGTVAGEEGSLLKYDVIDRAG
jgi:hypothetical protein